MSINLVLVDLIGGAIETSPESILYHLSCCPFTAGKKFDAKIQRGSLNTSIPTTTIELVRVIDPNVDCPCVVVVFVAPVYMNTVHKSLASSLQSSVTAVLDIVESMFGGTLNKIETAVASSGETVYFMYGELAQYEQHLTNSFRRNNLKLV